MDSPCGRAHEALPQRIDRTLLLALSRHHGLLAVIYYLLKTGLRLVLNSSSQSQLATSFLDLRWPFLRVCRDDWLSPSVGRPVRRQLLPDETSRTNLRPSVIF